MLVGFSGLMISGTPVNIIVGSHVWAEDPEFAWIDGEVIDIKGKDVTIVTTNGKTIKADISNIYPKDTEAPAAGVDDMTKLAYLHEPGVLYNLAARFALNEIYTYTGNILIAVNPFRRLPHLYDIHMMQQYKGATFGELSPHLFAIADDCYRAMINEHGSQSILVSGESGAGKTETTKMLMRYLAFMGGRSGTEGRTVEQQVLESNPVLEAFGNAKTVKNNNSSRFGKFVEIQFDKQGKISGAAVRTYLLERSRVCQVSDPERNYHCFYMLCAAPPEDVKRYKLGDPRTFHYLNQTNCYEVANIDDGREYLETRNAMDVVGINQDEQDAIFRVVAAILHLGNVDFIKGKEFDSSKVKDEKSLNHLSTAAELLMCDEKALEQSLCERVIVTPDGNITKPLDPEAAALSRDALAKTVYSRLFDCFEQLCINLTNEKLQQHFNQHVFKMEQEEYTKEEINWSYVEFVDNQDVLDLIEKQQLQALMETLSTTEPHYIRCVKPNTVLKPGIFENDNVLNQLRCGGVLEAIRISCAGYPTKRSFDEFLERFGMLAPDVLDGSDEKSACVAICDRFGLKAYQIGKSKVFLRAGQMAELDARRAEAARDAGALREAKDKLEKRVEELTWRLDFEKHLRVDLEEAKGQEITKLQNALQEMQGKLDEAHNQIVHEKEAARIAIEQAPPVIKEVPVVDNTKVEELENHNHELEDEIVELKKRVEEFEQKYNGVANESKNRLNELEESQAKISGLQETIERLDANLSNLESENQVLRQQALVASTIEELNEEAEQ
ncbi:hypothetical protein R6Q57_027855 [Mikania cordata]